MKSLRKFRFPKKVGYGLLIVNLLIFCLGVYFFLEGPIERVVPLETSYERNVILKPFGKEMLDTSPLDRRELIEYQTINLTEFLLNRTINITLKTLNERKISFFIANSAEVGYWEKSSIPQGDFFKENVSSAELTLSPKELWKNYYLVLQNKENYNVIVDVKLSQFFLVRTFEYDTAFKWLKIAFLAAGISFILLFVLKSTPDDLRQIILHFLFPERYDKLLTREISNFWIIFPIIISIGAIFVLMTKQFPDFTLINQILEDNLYRTGLNAFFYLIVMILILEFMIFLHDLLHFPLAKYYPDKKIIREHDRIFFRKAKKCFLKPYSLIFYFIQGIFLIIMAPYIPTELDYLLLTPTFIFSIYIVSYAYTEVQKSISIELSQEEFKLTKASVGSVFIVSVLFVFSFQLVRPLLELMSQRILDAGILVSHNLSGFWGLSSRVFMDGHDSFIRDFAYIVPLSMIIFHYFFIFYSVIRLPTKNQKTNLKETLFDLLFFFIVFISGLWLKYLLVTINPKDVLISLTSAFIAASFRNYLDALRRAPP